MRVHATPYQRSHLVFSKILSAAVVPVPLAH